MQNRISGHLLDTSNRLKNYTSSEAILATLNFASHGVEVSVITILSLISSVKHLRVREMSK